MNRSIWKGGLQTKFVIAFLIVGFVPGVAALFAIYLSSTSSLRHSIGNSFQEIGHSTALQIGVAVDNEISGAMRLATVPFPVRQAVELSNRQASLFPSVSLSESSKLQDFLNEWVRDADYYVRVALADKDGRVIAAISPQGILHDYAQVVAAGSDESVARGGLCEYVAV
jgi:hypothetical protein